MNNILRRLLIALIVPVLLAKFLPTAVAETSTVKVGIVLMHGKGGSPTKYVLNLASSLEEQGFWVANLEMPWSGRRDYDVNVSEAEREVESALNSLRRKGAKKLFVAGHSQGGLFALYFASKHAIDGVIAIAPGGNVRAPIFRVKVAESVDLARKLISIGKGDEKTRLIDYEGSRGTYPIITTPAVYLTWFAPDGVMNQMQIEQSISPSVPVLFISPTLDQPGLLSVKQQMFESLPKNPRTKLYEPNSNHLDAPSASTKEIVEWTTTIANTQ